MKLLAVVLCLALPAMAAEDAPLAKLDQPIDRVCITQEEKLNIVKNDAAKSARIAELENNVGVKVPIVIAVVVGALAVGAAVGAGATLAAQGK